MKVDIQSLTSAPAGDPVSTVDYISSRVFADLVDTNKIIPIKNGSRDSAPDAVGEGVALLLVTLVGGLGNLLALGAALACTSLRHLSSAFLVHHCLLDALKSAMCLPFGLSLLTGAHIPRCDVFGAGYILLMTVSAYNLLALVVNEEYQCSFVSRRYRKAKHHAGEDDDDVEGGGGDGCCVAFGVVIIWFSTVLLHLGVAFLPGSPEFSASVGTCIYRYGVTKNYVIHALWVVLVTGALAAAFSSFLHFLKTLRAGAKGRKWALLHKSLSSLSARQQQQHHNCNNTNNINTSNRKSASWVSKGHRHQSSRETASHFNTFAENNDTAGGHYDDEDDEAFLYAFDDLSSQQASLQARRYLRRVYVMLSMLASFILCWYPLFVLMLVDVHYRQPPSLYRRLTVLAWLQPLTTPVCCAFIYIDQARGERTARDVYTNALPLTISRSMSGDGPIRHNLHATGSSSGLDRAQTSSAMQSSFHAEKSSAQPSPPGMVMMGFHNHNFHPFSPSHSNHNHQSAHHHHRHQHHHQHLCTWSPPLPSPPALPPPPPPPPPPDLDSPTSLGSLLPPQEGSDTDSATHCETLDSASQCQTIVNYNIKDDEEGARHTLIM